jgi:Fe-S oxidoreductase
MPISATMAQSRLEVFEKAGAEVIVSNDPGCLMQMRKEAQERHSALRMMHLAEVLNCTI